MTGLIAVLVFHTEPAGAQKHTPAPCHQRSHRSASFPNPRLSVPSSAGKAVCSPAAASDLVLCIGAKLPRVAEPMGDAYVQAVTTLLPYLLSHRSRLAAFTDSQAASTNPATSTTASQAASSATTNTPSQPATAGQAGNEAWHGTANSAAAASDSGQGASQAAAGDAPSTSYSGGEGEGKGSETPGSPMRSGPHEFLASLQPEQRHRLAVLVDTAILKVPFHPCPSASLSLQVSIMSEQQGVGLRRTGEVCLQLCVVCTSLSASTSQALFWSLVKNQQKNQKAFQKGLDIYIATAGHANNGRHRRPAALCPAFKQHRPAGGRICPQGQGPVLRTGGPVPAEGAARGSPGPATHSHLLPPRSPHPPFRCGSSSLQRLAKAHRYGRA